MSRPRKSAAEKAITGAGKRPSKPAATSSPAASGGLSMPDWLRDPEALKIWRRVAPELVRLNIVAPSDADTFGRYCLHFAKWIKLTRTIEKEGETLMVKMTNSEERMPRMHPAVKVREVHERHLIDIEDRFGGSPLARYRLIAQQSAHPGAFGDLFRPAAPAPDSPSDMPPAAAVDSPIGTLRRAQLN